MMMGVAQVIGMKPTFRSAFSGAPGLSAAAARAFSNGKPLAAKAPSNAPRPRPPTKARRVQGVPCASTARSTALSSNAASRAPGSRESAVRWSTHGRQVQLLPWPSSAMENVSGRVGIMRGGWLAVQGRVGTRRCGWRKPPRRSSRTATVSVPSPVKPLYPCTARRRDRRGRAVNRRRLFPARGWPVIPA